MMISPNMYIENIEDRSYKDLILEKNKLVNSINDFEKHKKISEICIDPSPEVVYQCELEYLSELCKLISKKYREEYVWRNTNE